MLQKLRNLTLFTLCLTALGCGAKVAQVAVLLPMTGEFQSYGESSRKGVELAYEELQSDAAAPPIQLSYADTESRADTAGRLLDDLYAGGAHVAIGGVTSVEAAAMVEVAEARDRVLLSPSATDPALTRDSRHFFSIATPADNASSTMATFAARRLGVRRAVVLADSSVSPGVADAFAKAIAVQGGKVLDSLQTGQDDESLAAAVRTAVSDKADAVFVIGYDAELAMAVQDLRKSGFQGKILTTEDFLPAIERLGKDARGVLLTHTVYNGGAKGFVERFREKYGEEPDVFAAEGYDALKVLAASIAERPIHSSEFRKGLRDDIRDFSGVTGDIQFNERGAVTKYPRVYSVASNLKLRDHGKYLDDEAERIRVEKAKLQAQLAAIHAQASDG